MSCPDCNVFYACCCCCCCCCFASLAAYHRKESSVRSCSCIETLKDASAVSRDAWLSGKVDMNEETTGENAYSALQDQPGLSSIPPASCDARWTVLLFSSLAHLCTSASSPWTLQRSTQKLITSTSENLHGRVVRLYRSAWLCQYRTRKEGWNWYKTKFKGPSCLAKFRSMKQDSIADHFPISHDCKYWGQGECAVHRAHNIMQDIILEWMQNNITLASHILRSS